MAKPLTKIRVWYMKLSDEEKQQAIKAYNDITGASQTSFYRHLVKEPSKIHKHTLHTISNIELNDLYKEIQ